MKKGLKKTIWISVIVVILIIFIFKFAAVCSQKSMLKDGEDSPAGFGWGFSKCPFSCYYNLFSSTLITNRPVLDIFTTLGPTAYNRSVVMNRTSLYINISALNIGKTTIPYANVSIENTDVFQRSSIWLPGSDWRILNLPAMESRENPNFLLFRLRDDVPSLAPGKYNLKFRVICPICKEQVYYKYITICVYENDPVIDCGGIWWYKQR